MKLPHLALASALAIAPSTLAQELYDLSRFRTFALSFQQPDWWQQLEANYDLPTRPLIPADLTVDGVTYPNVGVRFRGASSYYGLGPTNIQNPPASAFKKPFKIEMNAFVPGQRLYGYETINLNNNFLDPSWMREVVTYRILRGYMPAPKSNFVQLTINGQAWGVYTNTEQINGDFMQQWFPRDSGNRYKAKRDPAVLPNFSALLYWGQTTPPYEAGFDLKTQSNPAPWVDLIRFCDVFNNTPPASRTSVLPGVMNIDQILWYLAGVHSIVSLDGYTALFCHNFYVVFDTFHGQANVIPWDQNISIGAANGGFAIPDLTQADPYFQEFEPLRPLMSILMQEPRWRARYRHHLRTVFRESYDWAVLGPEVATLRAMIDGAVQSDPKSLYTYQQYVDNLTQPITVSYWNPYPTQAQSTSPGIQPFIQARHAFLNGHADVMTPINDLSDLTLSPASPSPTDPLTFTVRVTGSLPMSSVSLYHRVQGPFVETAMFDDGQHGDGLAGDGVWGVVLPAQAPGTHLEYYAGADMSSTGAMNFVPSTAGHEPRFVDVDFLYGSSDVVINEFLALNVNGIVDEALEHEDWIELKNTGSSAVDISGWYMTDHLSNPRDWILPPNTVLAPGQTLLIWADNDAPDGPYHADFKLAATGEEIHLLAADGVTILDSIVFGPQLADVSTGRRRDGERRWVTYREPTPNATNEIVGCGKRRFSFVDPTFQPIDLNVTGAVQLGQAIGFTMQGGPASALHAVFFDVYTATIPLGFSRSVLLLGPLPFALGSASSDATGAVTIPYVIPSDTNLLGRSFWFQGFGLDPTGVLTGSNAVEMRFCP